MWLSVPPETIGSRALTSAAGEQPRVREHLLLVRRELGLQRLGERDGLRGDDVHQRPALRAREHSLLSAS